MIPTKTVKDKIEELLREGNEQTFRNNCVVKSHGTYGRPSPELLSWMTKVEYLVTKYYGRSSSPFRLFATSNIRAIEGYGESIFISQINIIKGVLIACLSIKNDSRLQRLFRSKSDGNLLNELLTNTIFWIVAVSLGSICFSAGLYFGGSKFDREKSELYQQNSSLKRDTMTLRSVIRKSLKQKDKINSQVQK